MTYTIRGSYIYRFDRAAQRGEWDPKDPQFIRLSSLTRFLEFVEEVFHIKPVAVTPLTETRIELRGQPLFGYPLMGPMYDAGNVRYESINYHDGIRD